MPESESTQRLANELNQQWISSLRAKGSAIHDTWPWQAAPEAWVDHLLTLMQETQISHLFLDPQWQASGKLSLRIDGLILPGLEFPPTVYERFLNALRIRVRWTSHTATLLQEGTLQDGRGNPFWVGFLPTANGTQVTLCRQYATLPTLPFENWSKPAIAAVQKMQQQPYGLIVCCNRLGSLSQQGTLFDVMASVVEHVQTDARLAWVYESLQTQLQQFTGTQIQVDGSPQSWQMTVQALIAQDIDVLVMRGRDEKQVVTQAVLAALEGRLAVVDVSCPTVVETLHWLLHELPVDAQQVSQILLGVVGSHPDLRLVCPACQSEAYPSDRLLLLLDAQGIPALPAGRWVMGQGCPACHGTGYQPAARRAIAEAIFIEPALADLCATRPTHEQLIQVLAEYRFESSFDQAFELARQGQTTLQEALRLSLMPRFSQLN
jgi:type II secretory ATPase GspE/PulE/Tfp pilus assembly ATPase PilB-like protein